jgi:hypothetical protein
VKRITIACKDDPKMCKRMVVTDAGYFCEITRCECFSQYEPGRGENDRRNNGTDRRDKSI